jgi:peptidoglycan hydrolase-like protein with peptidoglycan-binding domain
VRGQAAPTPDRITEIQTALGKSGAYKGDPSGKWDGDSVDAMKRFQQQNGISPSGKLDAQTLQKLGLGSDIAGRAAPRPPSLAGSQPVRNF